MFAFTSRCPQPGTSLNSQGITLCCQIRTARSLLGLVVSYPCGFLIWMDFFIFYPCGFYLGCGFSKVPADAFIRMVFHMLPLWFLGCDSTISYPCGFYSACVFSILPGDVFIRLGFLDLSPSGFYSACVFRKFPVMFLFRPCAQSSSIE